MKFRKLRRKLSAILCSAMMIGGSNISNHVAMAGGISFGGNMGEINQYGDTTFEENEVDDWENKFMGVAKNNNEITLGNEGNSKQFNGCLYEFNVKHRSVEDGDRNVKVGLYLLANNGFAISFNDDVKFGVLPFSYFVYLMKTAGIALSEFKKFDGMSDENKIKFLCILGWAFFGAGDSFANSYKDACAFFTEDFEKYVGPDVKGFGEFEDDINSDKKPISIYAIDGFEKANPKWQDGLPVFQPKVKLMPQMMPAPTTEYKDEISTESENKIPITKGKKTNKGFSPLLLVPIIGVPAAGVVTTAGVLVNKHKKGNSKIQKEVSNKTFLDKKRRLNTSLESAKTMVANKTSNNRRNANPRPNQRKYAGQSNRGFKQLNKQGL